MTNLDIWFPYLLINEGTTLSLDPDDEGNWTGGSINVGNLNGSRYGISAASYPNTNIKELTEDSAKAIYQTDFCNKINGDQLPTAIGWLLFDACVNSGVIPAVEWIQYLLGLKQDGICGNDTVQAITNYADQADLCQEYSLQHMLHCITFRNWNLYKEEYSRRIIFDAMIAQKLLGL